MSTVSWKAFWASLAAAFTLLIGVASRILPVREHGLITMGVLIALPIVVSLAANEVVMRSPMFVELTEAAKRFAVRLIRLSAVVHAALLLVTVLYPELSWQLLIVLAALGLADYWVARWMDYCLTRLPTPLVPAKAQVAAERESRVLNSARDMFAEAMDRAGLGHLVVGEPTVSGAAYRFPVRTPSVREAVTTGDGKQTKLKALTSGSAEDIAIALGEVLNRPLMTDWVTVTKERYAGLHAVTVVGRDVMGDVVPYVDSPGWTTIREEALVGVQVDSAPVRLNLAQHGQFIGKSGGGKTSLINVCLAHLTRCNDAVVWVCGAEKLYDTLGQWLDPYLDSGLDLPFDWIANGYEDSLSMLIAAMQVARYRQSVPYAQREEWPDLVVLLDEASFLLRNRVTKLPYQGIPRTSSEMVGMITQGARSAGVYIHLATQRGTNDMFGDDGGNTKTNFGFSAMFQTEDAGDTGRVIKDFKLPELAHKGEFYLRQDASVRRVKSAYIQEIAPKRPILHNGVTMPELALSRHAFRRQLDVGAQRAAGETYARRHRRMDSALAAYLTGDPAAQLQLSSGPQAMLEAEKAAFAAIVAPVVPQQAQRKTRPERIVEVVESRGGQVSRKEIIEALREGGDDVASEQVVDTALRTLVDRGQLARPEHGVYATA